MRIDYTKIPNRQLRKHCGIASWCCKRRERMFCIST